MTAFLLDANVVIAVVVAEHTDHRRAIEWIALTRLDASTHCVCPTVEGAVVRYLIRLGVTAADAQQVIAELERQFELLPETLSYTDVDLRHVRGHRQVTDAFLASVADRHNAVLATFDRAVVADIPSRSMLVGLD